MIFNENADFETPENYIETSDPVLKYICFHKSQILQIFDNKSRSYKSYITTDKLKAYNPNLKILYRDDNDGREYYMSIEHVIGCYDRFPVMTSL